MESERHLPTPHLQDDEKKLETWLRGGRKVQMGPGSDARRTMRGRVLVFALVLFEAFALSVRRSALCADRLHKPIACTRACASLLRLRGAGEGQSDELSERDDMVGALLQEVPERLDFPGMEEGILDYWDKVGALEQSEALARAEKRKPWIFFDGPPFATGMPHYGHILAGTIKDVVTRFWSQNGRLVERKWGWDCHGLPVEYEIEQALGIKSRDDVLKMGIPAFNAECRSVVMRYATEWKRVVRRLARWIDMDRDYKTLDATYMESVWWTCKQLHEKKLLYRGFKVMPYSTGCKTALSNFEANLNYKDVSDPAIIVRFPLEDDLDLNLLVWTTTPWTIPSNLAICVNADAEYAEVRDIKSGARFILMKARLAQLYGKEVDKSCDVLNVMLGQALVGRRYLAPFDFFAEYAERGAFRVVADDYVSADSGTGLVHMAPGFGEDDWRVCLREGVVEKDDATVCAVDGEGCFTKRIATLAGIGVKDADSKVIEMLKQAGRLQQHGKIVHSYPFCYRSETALIYKAVPSWFVKVESIKDRLLAHNRATEWVPAFVKEKRFHNWLESARDWAISRERYWGTPIPVWHSQDWEEVVCVGSVEELFQLSGVRVADLHREVVDEITIPSKRPGQPPLRRVSEVFDCWFESGAMPMAQKHYPFENVEAEARGELQADFIAEGLDQTRGWFYTLMVLSTALFDRPAFKNVIVNGLVLAADGKKMSKRLRNYPDPEIVINSTGADALRLYLISSPVVRAEPLRFKEDDVRAVVREVLLPWYNAYRMLVQSVNRAYHSAQEQSTALSTEDKQSALPTPRPLGCWVTSDNIMDRWIQSSAAQLVSFVRVEMEAYRLYTVVPRLLKFIDDLTNWYVRMNRARFKGSLGREEARVSNAVFSQVLMTLTIVMAPFTPLTSECLYLNLRSLLPEGERKSSIHHVSWPASKTDEKDRLLLRSVIRMQKVVIAGRRARDRRQLSLKIPAKSATVIVNSEEEVKALMSLETYIRSELNLRVLHVQTAGRDDTKLQATPDSRVLGKRLGAKFKSVATAIKALSADSVQKLHDEGMLLVCGEQVFLEEVNIARSFVGEKDGPLEAATVEDMGGALLLMDMEVDHEALIESAARELVNRVQKLKKKSGVSPADSLVIGYQAQGSDDDKKAVRALLESQGPFIRASLHHPIREISEAREPATESGTQDMRDPAHRSAYANKTGMPAELTAGMGGGGFVVGEAIEELSIGHLSVSIRFVMARFRQGL